MNLKRENLNLTEKLIKHGNRTIITVKQGEVGYAEDMGSPVLLPPGLHEWTSPTLKFIESVDLNNTCIRLVAPLESILCLCYLPPFSFLLHLPNYCRSRFMHTSGHVFTMDFVTGWVHIQCSQSMKVTVSVCRWTVPAARIAS
jgi:hypothetical protein